jgi:RNA polymerase sigma factor (sigma-70 family)
LPDQTSYDEKEILQKVSEGNEQAFSQLFHEHHQHLAAYVYKLTSSHELAEEVVLDVFLKIWTCRGSLIEVTNFRTWLYVISRNYTLNCLRRIVNERLKEKAWVSQQPSFTGEDPVPDNDQYEKAVAALHQLAPQQQKVFMLRILKNMKYQEIAKHLNLSRETVKSYIKLANASVSKFARSRGSTLELWVLMLLAIQF